MTKIERVVIRVPVPKDKAIFDLNGLLLEKRIPGTIAGSETYLIIGDELLIIIPLRT